MKTIEVIGIDPALRNFGYALATIDLDTNEIIQVEKLMLVRTSDDSGKKVRRNSDDLRRAKDQVEGLKMMTRDARIAFAEVPVGSQSARAMASYGICIGVLASCPCGLIEVTPTEVKVKATGSKTATKEEMIDWAYAKYPNAKGWLTRKVKGETTLKKENEHLADAIGAINAGLHTEQWKQVSSLLKTIN